MNAYDLPMRLRNCLNCVHLRQPCVTLPAGIRLGGCFERLVTQHGYDEQRLRRTRCGQWYLRPLDDTDY